MKRGFGMNPMQYETRGLSTNEKIITQFPLWVKFQHVDML